MTRTALVLGAGMVGVSCALSLQKRGFAVTLIDRREPGRETSYGNAGVLSRSSLVPPAIVRSHSCTARADRPIGEATKAGGMRAAGARYGEGYSHARRPQQPGKRSLARSAAPSARWCRRWARHRSRPCGCGTRATGSP
ncbi:MAG: hypothetical protein B7Y93_01840 [Micrococcales bacterium 32-70-13]|nr:MAG: hypothetical protein B7Y93_01840 [Micrococcales bacterium 32-70-13]